MRAKWKIIACLLAIVLVSTAFGGYLGAKYMERAVRKRNTPEAWNQKATRVLHQRLRLTPEQDRKMQLILDRGIEEMKAIRLDTVARTDAVVESMLTEFEKEITPEQRVEYDKIREYRDSTSLDMLKVEPRKK